MDEKSYESTLIFKKLNSHKTLYGAMLLHIIFDKADRHIRKYDSTNYLAFFHSVEKCKLILVD